MNAGRFVGASVAAFVVRAVLNAGFYGYLMHGEYERMAAAHPGMFREVVPAFLVLDLVAVLFITYLIVKAGSAFGGGIKGGVTIGVLAAILGPVLFSLYNYFSVTFYSVSFFATESVFQIVSHAIQGAVAAAIYKSA